jgi:hypothetical protein
MHWKLIMHSSHVSKYFVWIFLLTIKPSEIDKSFIKEQFWDREKERFLEWTFLLF